MHALAPVTRETQKDHGPARDPGSTGERVVVVGRGPASREASRLLEEGAWQVVPLRLGPGEFGSDALTGASVVVLDAAAGDDPLPFLERAAACAPRAAFLVLARAGSRWPGFESLPPPRPRIVPLPLSPEGLFGALDSVLVYRNLLEENRVLRDELRAAARLEAWVGCSAEAAAVRGAITTAAFSEIPLIIEGEPGTGRRLAAELVHRLSRRSSQAFVPLAADGLPPGELGAVLARVRRAAAGSAELPGTGALPHGRPGSVYLSGADRLASVDQAVLDDAFRRSQPFRLLVSRDSAGSSAPRNPLSRRSEAFRIRITPLRSRREDVPALTLHFLSAACRDAGVGPWGVSGATVEAYTNYDWPGNAAELRTWVERAVATAAVSRFDGSVLPDEICSPPDGPIAAPAGLDQKPLKTVLARIERTIITRALRRSGGNQKQAAQLLQVNPTTLHEKMKRHGLLRKPRRRMEP